MSALSEIPVQGFLEKLKARGVQLRVDGENIRVGWPGKIPDPEIRQAIIDRKPEILDTLAVDRGQADFINRLTETEREYYLNLLELMQSPKFGLNRETAGREAGAIIARNHRLLQFKQAAQNYRRYGYIKIFSTVLGKAVYLAQNERVAKCVPDQDIAVFLESDLEAVKNLGREEAKVLLEARILFGGPIKKGHD